MSGSTQSNPETLASKIPTESVVPAWYISSEPPSRPYTYWSKHVFLLSLFQAQKQRAKVELTSNTIGHPLCHPPTPLSCLLQVHDGREPPRFVFLEYPQFIDYRPRFCRGIPLPMGNTHPPMWRLYLDYTDQAPCSIVAELARAEYIDTQSDQNAGLETWTLRRNSRFQGTGTMLLYHAKFHRVVMRSRENGASGRMEMGKLCIW